MKTVILSMILTPALSFAISGPVTVDATTGVYGWASSSKKAAKPAAAQNTPAQTPAARPVVDLKPEPALQSVLLTGSASTHGKSIRFPVAVHQLSSADAAYVANLAKGLEKSKGLYSEIVITGYADISGSVEKNVQLSQERAESVRSALLASANLDASKVKVVGAGAILSDSIRASDRRAEISLEGVTDTAAVQKNLMK